MPAKLTFISIVHSVIERDSSNYTIRDAIVVVRNENNTTMDIKLTALLRKKIQYLDGYPYLNLEMF